MPSDAYESAFNRMLATAQKAGRLENALCRVQVRLATYLPRLDEDGDAKEKLGELLAIVERALEDQS